MEPRPRKASCATTFLPLRIDTPNVCWEPTEWTFFPWKQCITMLLPKRTAKIVTQCRNCNQVNGCKWMTVVNSVNVLCNGVGIIVTAIFSMRPNLSTSYKRSFKQICWMLAVLTGSTIQKKRVRSLAQICRPAWF